MNSIAIILLTVISCILINIPVFGQSKVGTESSTFLRLNASPTGAGTGFCVVTNVDNYSPIYNPGAAGIFILDRNVYGNLPLKFGYFTDDVYLMPFSFGLGVTSDFLNLENSDRLKFGLGVSYSVFKLGADNIQVSNYYYYEDPNGYTVDLADHAYIYSVSAGFQYFVRIGAGFSLKHINEELTNSELNFNTYDYGIYAELPLSSFWQPESDRYSSGFGFDITPSIGYAEYNASGKKFQVESNSYDQPNFDNFGYAMYGALTHGGRAVVSARAMWEKEKSLINRADKNDKNGVEIGAMEILYVRFGKSENDYIPNKYNTFGIGLNLGAPLFDLLDSGPEFLLRTDIRFDYARASEKENNFLEDRDLYGVSFAYSLR